MANIITIPENAIIYDIDIDMHSQGHWDDVYTKQYDTNTRYIRATIWNYGNIFPITTDKTITFSCTKPKTGYGIDNIAGIDENGKIVYLITDQTSVEEGNFKAEFRIYSTAVVGGATISKRETTFDFKMHVAKSALNDATVISSSEFNILTQNIAILGDLISDANISLAKINDIVATEEARVVAEDERIENEDERIEAEFLRPDYFYKTKAEYDALSQADKDNPKYVYEITDDDGELPTELQNLIDSTNSAKVAAESLVINRAGINDNTATLTEAYSGIKTQGIMNNIQSTINSHASELAETAKQVDVDSLSFNKAEKTYVDSEIQKMNSVVQGFYGTVALLTTAFPTGNASLYVVNADNYIYKWNGTSWVSTGKLYLATAIGSYTIKKNTLYNDIFERDYLRFGNIVSTQNYYPHIFVFPVSGDTVDFDLSTIVKYTDLGTSLASVYVTVFGSPTSTTVNTSDLTMLFEDIIPITSESQSIALSHQDVAITGYSYIKVMVRTYFDAVSNMPNVLFDEFSLLINGLIPTITTEGRWGAYTAGTATVTHLWTGNDAVAKKDDIPIKTSQLVNDSGYMTSADGVHLYVTTAAELVEALTTATSSATADTWYNIHLADGTYDLLPFIDLESITVVTATGYRGIEVPRHTRLIGSIYRGAKIIVMLTVGSTTTEQQWTVSPLNLKNDAELYNLYVYGKNTRYAVHDDGGNASYKRYVENCVFERDATETPLKMSNNCAYGNGLMSGCQEVFKDCEFISEDVSFYCHDNPTYTQSSKVELSNCRFKSTKTTATNCAMIHGLGATGISEVEFKQCSFNKSLYHKIEGATDSMHVTGYGNATTIGIDTEIIIVN